MSQTRFNRALVSLQLSVTSLRWQCHYFNKLIIKYLLNYTKNYGQKNILLYFDGIQSPKDFPVSIDLKKTLCEVVRNSPQFKFE